MVLLCTILVTEIFSQCIASFPDTEDFNAFSTVGNPQDPDPITLEYGWINSDSDDIEWVAHSGVSGSSNTGPSDDHTTGGNYLLVEASAPNFPGLEAAVLSPCYDISTLSAPTLYFWYHMYGEYMNSLSVDVIENGGPPIEIWSMAGDQGDAWVQQSLDLSAYIGEVQFRFRAVTGTDASNGWQSDIAIDDVTVGESQANIVVSIVQDNYPAETSWDLRDGTTNNIIASGTSVGGSYFVDPSLCYVFNFYDSYGDGICCGYGDGSYSVTLDGDLVASGGDFDFQESTSFNCPPGFSCTDAISIGIGGYLTEADNYWYSFVAPSTGIYEITTCNVNSCDTKIWVYDFECSQINVTENLEGTTFADDNDGGCGLQAVVNGIFEGGVNYYIRLGSNNNDCNGEINWSIAFSGPVVGCMDPASCNFEPLATVECVDCCIYPGDPACPDGPDLTINEANIVNSLNLSTYNISTGNCYFEEGCLLGYGTRNVLRFSTTIENIGNQDYYIGDPGDNPQMFDTQNCHGHAHFAGYADYLLFDQDGNKIPVGHKNGYCVIDVGCFGGQAKFGCSNMGISAQCYDTYGSGTTCNWIDITDVPAGIYTLVVRTNWSYAPDALGRHETDYTNNQGQVCLDISWNNGTPSYQVVSSCPPYTDCTGQEWGDALVDCNGNCDGSTKTGDLNLDDTWNMADAQDYVVGILGDDLSAVACNDLNADAVIDVVDAALVSKCGNFLQHYDSTASIIHYHPQCIFPRGWYNQEDEVTISIGNLNSDNQYFDVFIQNPDNKVLGYELEFSGMTIQSVENLVDPVDYPMTPQNETFGTKVVGLAYQDSTIDKNSNAVPLCRVHYWSLTASEICLAEIVAVVDGNANPVVTQIGGNCLAVNAYTSLAMKVLLEGPYDEGTQLLADALRSGALVPLNEPYAGLGFAHFGQGGSEAVDANIFVPTGNDAIVDWIMVEVRDKNDASTVLSTRSALLQRDGDVVELDGVGPLIINLPEDDYFISVRHRNHLGTMTDGPIHLSFAPISLDFTDGSVITYGTDAQKEISTGKFALWAGNTFNDGGVKYTGISNDRDLILQAIGGSVPTATLAGYHREDVTMEGVVKYTGPSNDRDPILVNIGGNVPTNSRMEQIP